MTIYFSNTRRMCVPGLRLGFFLFWCFATTALRAQGLQDPLVVKAEMLSRFPSYLEWPKSAFADARSPIRFGVVGNRAIWEIVRKKINGRQIGQRKCEVIYVERLRPAPECHFLFFPAQVAEPDRAWYDETRGKGIVTIGEKPGFAKRRGMFNFFLEAGRLRFEMNKAAAKRADVKINPRMLQMGPQIEEDD